MTSLCVRTSGRGDDLFFPGLFKHHTGRQSNGAHFENGGDCSNARRTHPNDELWRNKRIFSRGAFIGGLSGSPVFLDLGHGRGGGIVIRGPDHQRIHLLGLVHGHLNQDGVLDSAEDIDVRKFPQYRDAMNTGIAIIVPARDIESVLDRPELVAIREAEAKRLNIEELPVED
jgi:hypothetical protein